MNTKRKTLQRQIILDTIKSLDIHPTAEELYLEIQKTHPIVGKSTVYRNLRQLAQDGIITQIFVEGVARYDKNPKLHYHFICEICRKIFDIELGGIDSFNSIIESKYGFKAIRHDIEFSGACSNCTACS